jgi:hypothetical protein
MLSEHCFATGTADINDAEGLPNGSSFVLLLGWVRASGAPRRYWKW